MNNHKRVGSIALALLFSCSVHAGFSLNPLNWLRGSKAEQNAEQASVAQQDKLMPQVKTSEALNYFGIAPVGDNEKTALGKMQLKVQEVANRYGINSEQYKECLKLAQSPDLNVSGAEKTIFQAVELVGQNARLKANRLAAELVAAQAAQLNAQRAAELAKNAQRAVEQRLVLATKKKNNGKKRRVVRKPAKKKKRSVKKVKKAKKAAKKRNVRRISKNKKKK